jgi:hypothetical protein
MWVASARSKHNIDVEGRDTDLGSSNWGPLIFFNSCVCHSYRILSKYIRIYNKLCITLNIVTYKLLRPSLIIVVHRQSNVQVMEFDPSTFLLQQRIQCYKQVNVKNIWEERKIISYPPLGLADVIVHPVVVHRQLALSVQPVLHWDGSELWWRPLLGHHVPSLEIFDYPINLPLKLLLLGHVDVLCLMWLDRLRHHLQVV